KTVPESLVPAKQTKNRRKPNDPPLIVTQLHKTTVIAARKPSTKAAQAGLKTRPHKDPRIPARPAYRPFLRPVCGMIDEHMHHKNSKTGQIYPRKGFKARYRILVRRAHAKRRKTAVIRHFLCDPSNVAGCAPDGATLALPKSASSKPGDAF
ncbi:hypothetical protein, partial [Acetobacter cerevisiae]|uniref:hypothetical protein n=1 Tax=Acetobacter cerevisiae TaxID=178900 RepID=UPI001428A9EA